MAIVRREAICGEPMRRYEKPGREAVPGWMACGRRPGHPGRHESTLYVRSKAETRQPPTGSVVLAAALREARARAGLSQRHLAAVVGVSRSAVLNWERAERTPEAGNWTQLELALGPLGVVRDRRAVAEAQEAATGEAAA